ncbi:MAG: ECF transporter S component, partial [Candidatus Bathyarchaeota archaeon]
MKIKISSKELALTAVFAALYIAVATPPWKIPVIGGKGSLEPSSVLGPVFGFILGPYLGFIAAFLGALIALVLPPGFTGDMGGLLMPFTPAISAFVAGCLTSKFLASKKIKGWMIGALTLLILIICWFLYFFGIWNFGYGPITDTKLAYIVAYPILHVTGLMIPLIFRDRLREFFVIIKKGWFSIPVALICWSAMLSNHMLGNLIYVTVRWPVTIPSIMPDLPKIFIV